MQINISISKAIGDALELVNHTNKALALRASNFVAHFHYDPFSFAYTPIEGCVDPRFFYVSIVDTYGAIVFRDESIAVIVLAYMADEATAKAWGRVRRSDLDPLSGGLAFLSTDMRPLAALIGRPLGDAVCGTLSDAELAQIGVEEPLFAAVRGIRASEDLALVRELLFPTTYEALAHLCAGMSFAKVLELVRAYCNDKDSEDAKPAPTDDQLPQVLQNASTKERFQVNPSAHELRAIMEAPLEKWRVFLHPSQRKLVEHEWNGSVRVLGGPGTGKTVVALHRARWLAERCPKDKKVLLTTFTKTLVQDLTRQLEALCPPEVLERIEVCSLDHWVVSFLKRNAYEYNISYQKEAFTELWKLAAAVLPYTSKVETYGLSFIQEEWERVVQLYEIERLKDYCTTPRKGRRRALSRKERKELWAVFEEYRALLDERRLREPPDAMREARALLKSYGDAAPSYYAIIVDETQDMSPQALRLLRALVPEGKNDLFLVGDAYQRIYGLPVTLSSCGIYVRGRARKLTVNYRTTEQIRRRAVGYLKGLTCDNLDAEPDEKNDSVSLLQGAEPVTESFARKEDCLKALVAHLTHMLKKQVPAKDICITLPRRETSDIETILSTHDIPFLVLAHDQADDREKDGVRISTMHRIKGLEFDCVFLLDGKTTASGDEIRDQHAKCLRYVAATRARKELYILLV